ncbi:uncharacterized protein TM35_000231290 [Trypanosoma theileri]|uniref:SET domain-containing protein n=1 Tax=Trypanosoma theileri TaxID=67003 RepID=A0A1X0NRI0_9TRYP|nr:uncharacterized protein TM35_000231290 [Trypanosoma theileri]ORC87158.1 hypothetical protein TM35_000231290 [Trypanosoma theileri]
MLRLSPQRCIAFSVHRDTTKTPRMVKEVGTWLYRQETVDAFRVWCKANYVRGNGNVRVVSSIHYARCLRAAQHLRPGQAILTCPYTACFNFLVVARDMYNLNSNHITHNFPLEVNWMNYNERCSFLHGASISEMVLAGWMCRIASLEESSFTPYIKWLLEDTRGRDGIANGVSKERGDESGLVDHYFSEMATDACEDPEVFLENLFRSFAALHLRAVPIEPEAIRLFIPGTNFFKASADDMFVPTLIPLIDAVPQVEDGLHNTIVQFFPYNDDKEALKQQCREMFLSEEETLAVEKSLPNSGGGFFALRALCPIEKGDYLYLRGMPKLGDAEQESMTVKVMEANRLMNND